MASSPPTAHRSPALSSATVRAFGLLLAGVATALALWRGWHGALAWPFLGLAAALAGLALAWQAPLVPLARAWMALAEWLHALVNPVLMLLLYVLAVVPTGLLMRALGKDPLRLKRDPAATSYWVPREGRHVSTMKDQF